MKLTKWYPASIKPVRVGVYQRLHDDFGVSGHISSYSYWDGNSWRFSSIDLHTAARENHIAFESMTQSLKWRGLANKP